MIGFLDGFINFVAGFGVGGKDKSVGNSYYTPQRDLQQYEAMYRSSWAARRVLDVPALDMTREWRIWADEHDSMRRAERSFNLQNLVREAIIAGRKTGGAGIYIGLGDVSEDDLSEPLDPEKVKKGGLKYLTLFSRNELSVVEHETDPMSPRYRKGRLYSIHRGMGDTLRIHWTRFAWFPGATTSSEVYEHDDGWDDSFYVALGDLIKAADSALANLNALLPEARVDVIKIPSLASYFEDRESEERLKTRIRATQHLKSTVQALVLDGDEDYENKTTQFTGVVDVFEQTLKTLCGAADIPITRFLGTSETGLSNTGEGTTRRYYDGIRSRQNTELTTALFLLDQVLYRHVTGSSMGDVIYEWASLWQQSPSDKAETDKKNAETDKIYLDMGILEPEFLAMCILSRIGENKLYPGFDTALAESGDESNAIQIEEPVENVRSGPEPE